MHRGARGHVNLQNRPWRFWSEWRGVCGGYACFGYHQMPLSSPFFCPQQLGLPLPSIAKAWPSLICILQCSCHVFQVPAVTSGIEQGWRGGGGEFWHDERPFLGDQWGRDPAASSKGHPGCRAPQPRGEWAPSCPAPLFLCQAKGSFIFYRTWRKRLVRETFLKNCFPT